MATMFKPNPNTIGTAEFHNHFVVVHPLDDLPEQKVNIEDLGPMPMTASVRISLLSLRAYLVLMILLVLYHVLDLSRRVG
jgi:hypothetical protein